MIELYTVRIVRGAENSQQTSDEDILNIHLSESEGISHLPLKLLEILNLSTQEHGVEFFTGEIFGNRRKLNLLADIVEDGEVLLAVVRPLDLSSEIEKMTVKSLTADLVSFSAFCFEL